MRWTLLILCCLLPLSAQDEAKDTTVAKRAAETEAQRGTRSISLRDLEEAEKKLAAERERWAKSERRLNTLLEDLNNRTADIESKTENLQKMLDASKNEDAAGTPVISQNQIDHWNSRNPDVAAKDFVLLYKKEPLVAVGIVKGMKKKKSAALIDAVSLLDQNGREVAAKLHKIIGTEQ